MPSSNTLTIRSLDPVVKKHLRLRAASNGRSMEAEAREILRTALMPESGQLVERIRAIVDEVGGFEFEVPEREKLGDPPCFD